MKKTAFDRRNIKAGVTVIRVILTTPKGTKTTLTGLVSEITEDSITLLHNFKKDVYKISDLIGISILREI